MSFNKNSLHRIIIFVAAVPKFSHKRKHHSSSYLHKKLVSIEISVKPGKDSTSTLSSVIHRV
jgi:hypothetical protein